MAVEQIQELLELTRLAIEPIQVPHDHCRRGGEFDLLEEALVAGAGPVLVGGDGFVDELDRACISESVRYSGAVSALLLDGGVLAGPVDGDSEIDQGGVELYKSAPVLPGRTAVSRPRRASCQARRQRLKMMRTRVGSKLRPGWPGATLSFLMRVVITARRSVVSRLCHQVSSATGLPIGAA